MNTFEKENMINEIEELLDEYNYSFSRYAISDIINTWAYNKKELIDAFKNHPNYIEGKYMISFNVDFHRPVNIDGASEFINWLFSNCIHNNTYRTALPSEIYEQAELEHTMIPHALFDAIYSLNTYYEPTISESMFEKFDAIVPNAHFHKGAKTSRSINRLCKYLGYDKHPDYNRQFGKYSDSLSPVTLTRHTIISLNPIDYLTMSFGNTWSSCHTIDIHNMRGMPNTYRGMYSSGTMSYMLDGSSIIMYTVDENYVGNDFEHQPKVNRQMFHYGNGKLIQGRLYPEDYLTEIIDEFRNIMQRVISETLNIPNMWTLKRGTGYIGSHVKSYGTHYRDYVSFNNCTISFSKELDAENNGKDVKIGHTPICVECGEEHDIEDNINCCHSGKIRCADCGSLIDEDDAYYYNGEYYCYGCVAFCECCNEYVHTEDVTYVGNGEVVCDRCLDQYYARCEICGEWFYIEDMNPVGDDFVCESCFEHNCTVCDDCGENIYNEDAIEINGDYYCEDCVTSCSGCGEVIPISCANEVNGEYYCDDCYERMEEEDEEEAV